MTKHVQVIDSDGTVLMESRLRDDHYEWLVDHGWIQSGQTGDTVSPDGVDALLAHVRSNPDRV